MAPGSRESELSLCRPATAESGTFERATAPMRIVPEGESIMLRGSCSRRVVGLGFLANRYGQSGGFADGDTDGDGVVDIPDLGNLANDYDKTYLQ